MSDAWNGVPENPERDGWHWFDRPHGVQPAWWDAQLSAWKDCDGEWHEAPEAAAWTRIGPCALPSEVAALRAALDAAEERASFNMGMATMAMEQKIAMKAERDAAQAALLAAEKREKAIQQQREADCPWFEGPPAAPHGDEWFIAVTTYGDRVVLRSLPKDWTYDFRTADDTYIKADKIKQWMPFPDSHYVPPERALQPPADLAAQAAQAPGDAVACGGCGAKSDAERCVGCMHDFGTPDSAWVRARAGA